MSETRANNRIAFVTAVAVTQYLLLRGQNPFIAKQGFELHSIASPGPYLDRLRDRDGVHIHPVSISRWINPFADIVSLFQVYAKLRKIRPDIVHLSTPKAALIGAIASLLARVPVRIYVVRGLATEDAKGLRKVLYCWAEWLTAKFCHECICVSPSLLEFAHQNGIVPKNRGVVLGSGMSNGIDTGRFNPAIPACSSEHVATSITQGPVLGFVGRLAKDKGIEDLAAAWKILRDEFPATRLRLVGDWEAENSVNESVREELIADPRVDIVGFAEDVIPHYAQMSVFVFPSHGTEGFPNAPMEAAAMELPVVATEVVGCVDAVEPGVTGVLVPPHSPALLADALRPYLCDEQLRRAHGRAGRERAVRDFQPSRIWEAIHVEYCRLLYAANLPVRKRQIETADVRLQHPSIHALENARTGRNFYRDYGKRMFDLLVTMTTLPAWLPLLALIFIAVRIRLGRPVFFRQRRPGLAGREFELCKFRSMVDRRDEVGQPLDDSQRLGTFGKWLRATSLDELPELWNVLRGEMSLVGPRPLLSRYLDRYTARQTRRHEVKPGLTGWAQVNGRNGIDWDHKLELDVWYVDHCSFWLDVKILFKTVLTVFRRQGVNSPNHATMPEFLGTQRAESQDKAA